MTTEPKLTETITISKKRYEQLYDAEKKLMALENGGVDNWEWYHESLKTGGYFDDEDEETEEDIYGE